VGPSLAQWHKVLLHRHSCVQNSRAFAAFFWGFTASGSWFLSPNADYQHAVALGSTLTNALRQAPSKSVDHLSLKQGFHAEVSLASG
jgi:hypothetical protein